MLLLNSFSDGLMRKVEIAPPYLTINFVCTRVRCMSIITAGRENSVLHN